MRHLNVKMVLFIIKSDNSFLTLFSRVSSAVFRNFLNQNSESMTSKTAKKSLSITTDLVFPSDTNGLNEMFGGELLSRVDRICCIAAQRHSNQIAVTISVNHVVFTKVIPLGSTVTIEAKVSRDFGSSGSIC